jgi:hypothetical protein
VVSIQITGSNPTEIGIIFLLATEYVTDAIANIIIIIIISFVRRTYCLSTGPIHIKFVGHNLSAFAMSPGL